jgi:3-hydroxyacyl-CoA dehydrogenase
MQALIDKYSINSPHRGTKLSTDAIVNRILFPLVNEGFKILEDGIASDPSQIDIIYLYGYGWPAWRGMVFSSPPALAVVYVSSHQILHLVL